MQPFTATPYGLHKLGGASSQPTYATFSTNPNLVTSSQGGHSIFAGGALFNPLAAPAQHVASQFTPSAPVFRGPAFIGGGLATVDSTRLLPTSTASDFARGQLQRHNRTFPEIAPLGYGHISANSGSGTTGIPSRTGTAGGNNGYGYPRDVLGATGDFQHTAMPSPPVVLPSLESQNAKIDGDKFRGSGSANGRRDREPESRPQDGYARGREREMRNQDRERRAERSRSRAHDRPRRDSERRSRERERSSTRRTRTDRDRRPERALDDEPADVRRMKREEAIRKVREDEERRLSDKAKRETEEKEKREREEKRRREEELRNEDRRVMEEMIRMEEMKRLQFEELERRRRTEEERKEREMAVFTQQLVEQEAELRRLQEEEKRLLQMERRSGDREREDERRRDLERIRRLEETQRREVRRGRDDRDRRRSQKSREEIEIDQLVEEQQRLLAAEQEERRIWEARQKQRAVERESHRRDPPWREAESWRDDRERDRIHPFGAPAMNRLAAVPNENEIHRLQLEAQLAELERKEAELREQERRMNEARRGGRDHQLRGPREREEDRGERWRAPAPRREEVDRRDGDRYPRERSRELRNEFRERWR